MIIHRNAMKTELKEHMRGGDGTVTLVHFDSAENMKNCRLMAELTIPPGASIGEHSHDEETEYYIILSGTGIVVDEGTERAVGPGDVVVTGNGASHSIRNSGSVPLVFHAVIVTYGTEA
ncbi:cupin domain-containing protein [Breznakiella homolactica]|uniref:Cupin domain-containing protein n=1 Tax=Breznakiella homolactica TaxID=2798577 RepID=A0A7T7XND8_9SPIR|nr:cupin domain-containing protein [Breznakiella homolactica]QQO09433.1 cupin domain-containing protein [Breznakiella homolactica]